MTPNSNPETAYTDAPPLHPNLVLGSVHLLFWLFVHPAAWRSYVARLDARLPADFAWADLNRGQWRNLALRRLLLQGHLILPLLASLPTGLILWLKGLPLADIVIPATFVLAINLTLGLMIGSVTGVAAGLAGSVAVGLVVGVINSAIDAESLSSVLSTAAAGLAIAATLSLTALPAQPQSADPLNRGMSALLAQSGAIVLGVLGGVLGLEALRLGLTTLSGLTVGWPETIGYNLARTVVVGSSYGLALGWYRGLRAGLSGGVIVGFAYAFAVTAAGSSWAPVWVGLGSGLLFGTSFGVTVVLPYILSERLAGRWAGAWAGALGSWGRHVLRNQVPLWPALPLGLLVIPAGLSVAWWRPVLLYPFVAAWNLLLFRLEQQRDTDRPSLLRWHAAFWAEQQRLPLIGLDQHLLLICERHPAEGQAALAYLRASPQRWAAQAVQIELEARHLAGCGELAGIAQAHQHLAAGDLSGPAGTLLRRFAHLSQDVEAGLNQTTAYHQRLALSAVAERLSKLIRELTVSSEPYAARFYPIATAWQQRLTDHLSELAQAVEQSQEIDNPYVVGVPLTEEQEIFIGRVDIVARIEQLLLDRRRPPLLLYGQRRMGKTSLLRNLGRLLPRPIVPLFVDGQRVALAGDYADFLANLAGEMRRSATQQRGLSLPELERAALAASPFTQFNAWLDAVEQQLAAQEFDIALLALDEFEVLDSSLAKGRFDAEDVLNLLRTIIQHRPQFKVMLAGSHTLAEFQRWASYLINVQLVKIGYLAETEARQLIERPVKEFALAYESVASRRVLELTRGHPALVQLLCYELVTLKNEQSTTERRLVRLADVEQAVARAFESGSFFFADIERNQIDAGERVLLRFIAAQGEGAVVSRAALAGQVEPTADLDQMLARLVQRDLLEAVEEGYRFQVELIRRWFGERIVNRL